MLCRLRISGSYAGVALSVLQEAGFKDASLRIDEGYPHTIDSHSPPEVIRGNHSSDTDAPDMLDRNEPNASIGRNSTTVVDSRALQPILRDHAKAAAKLH